MLHTLALEPLYVSPLIPMITDKQQESCLPSSTIVSISGLLVVSSIIAPVDTTEPPATADAAESGTWREAENEDQSVVFVPHPSGEKGARLQRSSNQRGSDTETIVFAVVLVVLFIVWGVTLAWAYTKVSAWQHNGEGSGRGGGVESVSPVAPADDGTSTIVRVSTTGSLGSTLKMGKLPGYVSQPKVNFSPRFVSKRAPKTEQVLSCCTPRIWTLEKLRCLLQVLRRLTSVLWSTQPVSEMKSLDGTEVDECMGAAAFTDTAYLERQLTCHISRAPSPAYGNLIPSFRSGGFVTRRCLKWPVHMRFAVVWQQHCTGVVEMNVSTFETLP